MALQVFFWIYTAAYACHGLDMAYVIQGWYLLLILVVFPSWDVLKSASREMFPLLALLVENDGLNASLCGVLNTTY